MSGVLTFKKNAFLDNTGTVVVNYVYDAWGNHAVVDVNGNDITATDHIGVLNPFRYRGYYYDVETGLYYLQTRYYDPELCRFISQDSVDYADPEKINGLNLYAYCYNNPVMYIDSTGHLPFLIIALIIGAIIGATIGGAVAYSEAKKSGASGWDLFWWTLLGIICGGLIGAAIGAAVGAAAPAISAAASAVNGFLSSSFVVGSYVTASGAAVAVTVTGAQIVAGATAAIALTGYLFSRLSGKERATDKPSWVNPDMVDFNKSPQQNAFDILNEKYGIGEWAKGPGTEFSKIVKWIARNLFLNK